MNRFMGYLAGNGLPYFIFEAAKREAFSHSLGRLPPIRMMPWTTALQRADST
jgi:hypothetical protein